jgi:class 3 adenylate cyclase
MAGAPRTRYARSGDVSIAYQAFGEGPIDLVWIPGFVTHLDLFWDHPLWAHIARRAASWGRVVTFDKRGTGLSDRPATTGSVEDRMDDVRAVMDAAGVDRAVLMGFSEGGPLSILFAATYPERVQALVLGSTYAQPIEIPDLEQQLVEFERFWGSGHPLRFFAPHVDLEYAARFERSSATPRAAAEILRANAAIDVRAALPAITAPTLVFHNEGDPVVPVALGRALAEGIAGARFVLRAGDTHEAATIEDWNDELDEIEEWLTGTRRAVEPDRVLATVLFTDVVSSTEQAAAVGDRDWRHRLEQLQGTTERLVRQFGGRLVKGTGDGVLATFDGPARAVRCAAALVERATAIGLPIRAGLHAGEVELVGDDIAGIAVHLAKRVETAAAPGSVYVSRTVRDLVAGSGIAFADRGPHELKGIPGTWELAEVVTV